MRKELKKQRAIKVIASEETDKIYKQKIAAFEAMKSAELKEYEGNKRKYEEEVKRKLNAYAQHQKAKEEYELRQHKHNAEIDRFKQLFEQGEPKAVERYKEIVLGNSNYPDEIKKDFKVQFEKESKTMIVCYKLPSYKKAPRVIRYICCH